MYDTSVMVTFHVEEISESFVSRQAVVSLCHSSQAVSDAQRQLLGAIPPAPVSRRCARQVHAPFCSYAQHVLKRKTNGIRYRRHQRADQHPVDFRAIRVEVEARKFQLLGHIFRSSNAVALSGAAPPS